MNRLSPRTRHSPEIFTVCCRPKTDVTPATKLRDFDARQGIASVTGRVARCVMARRTVARLVFRIEHCAALFYATLMRVRVVRQRRATKSQVWHRCKNWWSATLPCRVPNCRCENARSVAPATWRISMKKFYIFLCGEIVGPTQQVNIHLMTDDLREHCGDCSELYDILYSTSLIMR